MLQYLSKVLFMFLLIARVDQYIIKEHYHELIQEGTKYPIHEAHKHSRGIRQTEGYYCELIVPIPCAEHSLVDVTFHNVQLMIP